MIKLTGHDLGHILLRFFMSFPVHFVHRFLNFLVKFRALDLDLIKTKPKNGH